MQGVVTFAFVMACLLVTGSLAEDMGDMDGFDMGDMGDMDGFDVGDMDDDEMMGGGLHSSTIVDLTAESYAQLVQDDKTSLFIKFYAPWCGHCRSLAPDWSALGDAVADVAGVRVAAMDCTEGDNQALCSEFGVEGFPTLKYVDAERRTIVDYEGARGLQDMMGFLTGDAKTAPGSAFHEDQGPVARAVEYATRVYSGVVGPVMEFNPYVLPAAFLLGTTVSMALTCCWCFIGSPRVIIEFQTTGDKAKRD